MIFVKLRKKVSKNCKSISQFCHAIFLFFVYFLRSFINEKLHSTVLVLREVAVQHILKAKMGLYRFDSDFSQSLIDFSFVVSLCVVLRVTA